MKERGKCETERREKVRKWRAKERGKGRKEVRKGSDERQMREDSVPLKYENSVPLSAGMVSFLHWLVALGWVCKMMEVLQGQSEET